MGKKFGTLAKPGYKLEFRMMVNLDCNAHTGKMCLKTIPSHMIYTSFATGIHVHHVKQQKKEKLSKASHLGPNSTLICISILLHTKPLPLNSIIPQQILGF